MDCNKDDAIKAKEVAERKFNAKDVSGAKKFALKAQALFPGLEGISQLLSTLDVYQSAENQINGEPDWYGILRVGPQADNDTIQKQYQKLCLMLHPDKNKSVGARGAFKLVSEAWSLLSDRNKRAAYDAKRNSKGFPPKVKPSPAESSSMPPPNRFYNFAKTAASSSAKVSKNSFHFHANGGSSGSTSNTKSSSFWTVCHFCMTHYEYKRTYLNHNLVCPNCKKIFFAIETTPPVSNGRKSSKRWNSGSSGKTNCGSFWSVCHRCRMRYEYKRTYLNQKVNCLHCQKRFLAIEIPPRVSNGPKSGKPWNSGSSGKTNCGSFWTVCHRCNIYYEYKKTYLNLKLICPNCKKPFFALETPAPVSNGPKSGKPWNSAPQYSDQESRNKNGSNVRANVVHQRVCEEAQSARKRERAAKSCAFEIIASSSVKKKRRANMGIDNEQTGSGISTGEHSSFRSRATFSI